MANFTTKSDKLVCLEKTLDKLAPEKKFALAFSGGVDSTVLLDVAVGMGMDVLAVTFNTNLTEKMISISDAEKYALQAGASHVTVSIDVLSVPEVRNNSKDRCYYCKSKMFQSLKDIANEKGYTVLCDGTNADDLSEYRPGLKAKAENNVNSPIALSGLTKQDVREIGRALGLEVAEKPSAPCLMTRFPYDTYVDDTMLETAEKAETILKGAGFGNLRFRIHGDVARIEIPKPRFHEFLTAYETFEEKLKLPGINYVTLDLKGLRSGSMDTVL